MQHHARVEMEFEKGKEEKKKTPNQSIPNQTTFFEMNIICYILMSA